MRTILDFKKGDEVVRVEPAKAYLSGARDRSYLGEKLNFRGIANGMIYLKCHNPIFERDIITLPLDLWSGGWEYYTEPSELIKDDEPAKTIVILNIYKQ